MSIGFVQGIGPLELALLLLILLVVFGGRRLPQMGRQLGEGLRGFKESITGKPAAPRDDAGRHEPPALGRPAGEETPLDGEVMRDRS